MEQDELYQSVAKQLEIVKQEPGLRKEILVARINELLETDFNRLIAILYRMDVSETKLRALLARDAGRDAAVIITDLVIERQLQKIKSREQYRQRNDDIGEHEKW